MGDIGLCDRGNDPTTNAIAVTKEDVDGKDLLQELGPSSAISHSSRNATGGD
jgi:hypothetical protein